MPTTRYEFMEHAGHIVYDPDLGDLEASWCFEFHGDRWYWDVQARLGGGLGKEASIAILELVAALPDERISRLCLAGQGAFL